MAATYEIVTVNELRDSGTVRLADCRVEHGTITAHTLYIDSK